MEKILAFYTWQSETHLRSQYERIYEGGTVHTL